MPSLCPKLESFIKVMHRRMAKNDQKFTKNCFCRELSLKSGKIIFYEFWMIFGHSTVHHLKKTPKNTWKLHLQKKTPFLGFFEKYRIFCLSCTVSLRKIHKNQKKNFLNFFQTSKAKSLQNHSHSTIHGSIISDTAKKKTFLGFFEPR